MPMELVPLCTLRLRLRKPFRLPDTPAGTVMVFEIESGEAEGERLRGHLVGNAAADWMTVGPDGTGTLDVQFLLETDDAALVRVRYRGRMDMGGRSDTLYSAPRFDTGDERYAWLNRVQAVAKGTVSGGALTYEVAELR